MNDMNRQFFFVFLVFLWSIIPASHAQKKITDKEHRANVAESNGKSNYCVSRDTLYCSGQPKALVQKVHENLLLDELAEAIYLPGGTDILILVDKQSYRSHLGENKVYYQVDFPTLDLTCDIREGDKYGHPFSQFCRYNLLTKNGLDTNQVFLFTTLKGRISEEELNGRLSLRDSVNALRSVVVKRNTEAEVQITDENIYQDGAMFASYVEDTLNGQTGLLRHYQLYNSKGVLVCTATETQMNSHEWRLLTYKDNKYHSVSFKSNDDLRELILYLIKLVYI